MDTHFEGNDDDEINRALRNLEGMEDLNEALAEYEVNLGNPSIPRHDENRTEISAGPPHSHISAPLPSSQVPPALISNNNNARAPPSKLLCLLCLNRS